MSAFAEQQAIASNAIKQFLDSQTALHKRVSVINSDIFKTVGLKQSNLNSIASQLTRNIDLGIGDSMARMSQFVTRQSSWLKGIGPALANMKAWFYPQNLRGAVPEGQTR